VKRWLHAVDDRGSEPRFLFAAELARCGLLVAGCLRLLAVRHEQPGTGNQQRASVLGLALLALSCTNERPATQPDDLGRAVTMPARVERVVTLAPNLTEMIFAAGAGAKIVGTDDSSNFPVAARALPKVGGMQPNIEKIVALQPDLVLASTEGNHPNLGPALAAAKIPLFVIRTDRIREIPPAIRRLGVMLDAPDAEAAAVELERAVQAERRSRPGAPRVLFVVWTDPLYVAGKETFTDDLFALTGAQNVVQIAGWPQLSLETLVAAPPDLILYPRGAVTPQQVDALLQRVTALEKIRVVPVNEDIFQRPGPRVALAAKSLNAILDAP
jgi:iron complex transport system substrate-binding protein